MPTVLQVGPYRFFFYATDCPEPPHIHIQRENKKAKFWLSPVRLQSSGGFNTHEINRLQKIIEEYAEKLLEEWNEYCHD